MIGANFKKCFFDRRAVLSRVDVATRRVLSKFGSWVRQGAKTSIKRAAQKKVSELTPEERGRYEKRKAIARKKGLPRPERPRKPSAPGEPPRSHTDLLKRFIFFGYEPGKRTVVIGPARLNQKVGDAPHALEHGGRSRVVSGSRRGRRKTRTVRIRPRPYMGPAFARERLKLPAMWRDSIR